MGSRVVVFANDQPSTERRIDFAVFFIGAMEIQKIQMAVHIFPGFALFTELM